MQNRTGSDAVIGVFTTDADLVIRVWDGALARMTGIPPESVRGKNIVDVIPDLERRRLLARFRHVLDDGVVEVLAPAFHHYLIPCLLSNPSPHFQYMQQRITIAPMREGDQIAGTLVTLEDVTARLERERELAEQLSNPEVRVRLEAAETLANDETLEPSGALLGALSDDSWMVRRVAVDGLARRAAPEAISALLESVRANHLDFRLLNSALQVLKMSEIDTVSPLIEFLGDDDADLRMQAALALGDQHARGAVPVLIEHALGDADINVRYHAIEALGKIRAFESADALTTIAESKEFFLAFPALEALGAIGESSVAARIVPLLEDDQLRDAAADTLSQIGDEEIVSPLTALLCSPNAPTETVAAALAGLYFKYKQTFGEGEYIADLSRRGINATGVQNLLDALNRETGSDLRSLALVAGWLEGPTVERALTRLLGKPAVNVEIIEALVRHGSGVTELLVEQLDAEDLDLRKAAIVALGRIGDRRAALALTQFLNGDVELAIAAANALAQIGDVAAFDALISVLGDPNAAVRQAAIGALNSIGSPEMPARLKPLLFDDDPNVRESAVRVAGYFGYPDFTDLLLERCHDKDERVRRAAIEHIAFLDDDRAASVLITTLKSEEPKVRASAAAALSMIESDEARAALTAALNDQNSWVRYFAMRSLGKLRSHESLDALSRAANDDPANHVRIAAIEALGIVGGELAVESVRAFAGSEIPDIAGAAILALGEIPGSAASAALSDLLLRADKNLRVKALTALSKHPDISVVENVQRVIASDANPEVIETGIETLRRIGTAEAIAALLTLTVDQEKRGTAMTALSRTPEGMLDELALGLLPERAIEMRTATVDILARIKSPAVTPFIERAMDDADPVVRQAAKRYLRAMFHRFE